jgi:hypothetical protein
MLTPSRIFAHLLLLTALIGCRDAVNAPEPAREEAWIDSFPPSPAGTIVAPLTVDLQSALAAAEAEVPRRFGSMDLRLKADSSARTSYAFVAEREPFTVRFAGDTILATATIHYQGRGWYDPPIGPTITGGCGTEEPRPRARLTLRILAGLDTNWRLRTRIRLREVRAFSNEERDQCEVSLLKLNVTGKVIAGAQDAIRKALPVLDRQLLGLDVRSPLETIWRDLLTPIKVGDSLWLLLRPEGVSVGPLTAVGGQLISRVGVRARPGLVTGSRPTPEHVPLPALGRGLAEDGFMMQVEGRFDYPVIGEMLTQALAGTMVKTPGGAIRVDRLHVIGLGRGRVGLGLTFSGSAKGIIWLVGSPAYNAESRFISVPDLELDASSAGLLVRGFAWLKGPEIMAFLRKEARLPADSLLNDLAIMAERESNLDLAPGVRLGTVITGVEPVGIFAGRLGIVLRAHATGTASLELGPEVFKPVINPKATAKPAAPARSGAADLASGSRRSPPGA